MKYIVLFCLLAFSFAGRAQDFTYGTVERSEYDFDRNKLDSNANAVVLNEFGSSRMQINNTEGRIEIVHIYHVRIKIYNDQGFDNANVVIPLYKDTEKQETVTGLTASTFNLENNHIQETKLDPKSVYFEARSKYTNLMKFAMPNIKAGSVIEYTYKLVSPLLFNFRTWDFQASIPKIRSEYQAIIPAVFNYNVSLRGALKLTQNKGEVIDNCIGYLGSQPCSKMSYVMDNVPAFVREEYMTAASNFRSAIYFELSDQVSPSGGTTYYTKKWSDIDNDLVIDKTFGDQIKKVDLFKSAMPQVLAGTTDELSKAKAVTAFIKREIKWNGYYGLGSESTVKKAMESHSGNIGDVNLALVAALSAAGLNVEAMLLSTRENGVPNKLYPVLTDFNYVVAKLNVGDKSYLLDATEPTLPFGLLPLRCINDQGRVIPLKKPSYWYDIKASQRSSTTYMLNGELTADGKIKGKMSLYKLGYAAYNRRSEIKAENSIEEFVEKLDEKMANISISNYKITNVDSAENALSEEYDVEFQVFDGGTKDQFYLSPFIFNKISTNPFKLNERTYPVDLGSAFNDQSIINIKLNGDYTMAERPQDKAIGLPDAAGRYIFKTTFADNNLSINQNLQINKPIFEPHEYPSLKSFYSQILQSHKTEFLFKRSGK